MANNKGFPSNPSQLTSAVRKALFTSATVTAIAVGAPGHNAYAQQVGACNPIETEFTSGTVQCSGEFDASINYEVKDFTVVDGNEVPNDITVVVAEGSTGTGISVSSLPADASAEPAEGSVVIESHGDITQAAGSELVVPEENIVDFEAGYGLRHDGIGMNGQYTGYTYNRSVKLDESGAVIADTETAFADKILAEDLASYLGVSDDADNTFNMIGRGPEEAFSIVVAAEGELQFEDQIAIKASSEAGDISITNTGDIEMGSGVSVDYFVAGTGYRGVVSKTTSNDIDTDGDGIVDTRIYGSAEQVWLLEESGRGSWAKDVHKSVSAYTIGIAAESISGDIAIVNEGAIAAGDVSRGIIAETETGNIAISNSGDIAVGADAVAISAASGQKAELAHSYGYTYDASVTFQPANPAFGRPQHSYMHNVETKVGKIYRADGAGNSISVANSGSISVGAGSVGVDVHNPSGDQIVIENSGDIIVGAGEGGVAISANANAGFETFYGDTYVAPPPYPAGCGGIGNPCQKPKTYFEEDGSAPGAGEPGFNEYGLYYTQMSGLPATEYKTPHYFDRTEIEGRGYVDDLGDIIISNTGNIDISAATSGTAILAQTYGSTIIENSGSITVGAGEGSGYTDTTAKGIATEGVGETTVVNSGDIQLTGEDSTAVDVSSYMLDVGRVDPQMDIAEATGYFVSEYVNDTFAGFGGDTLVVNDGSISGDLDKSDIVEYSESGTLVEGFNLSSHKQVGISFATNNSSLRSTTNDIVFASYSDATLEAWEEATGTALPVNEDVEFFSTDIINNGDIALGDIAEGIAGWSTYGEVNIVNNGSITLGDGVLAESANYNATRFYSRGINILARGEKNTSDISVYNSDTGVITTGDMSGGIRVLAASGSASVVNAGEVNVGSGLALGASEGREEAFYTTSIAIQAATGLGVDNYAVVVNSGLVTTGDNSAGVLVSNSSGPVFVTDGRESAYSAAAFNAGTLATGDNSVGLIVNGIDVLGFNDGTISVGDGQFRTPGQDPANGAGMRASGSVSGVLRNEGIIEGGDSVDGMDAYGQFAGVASQGETGSIAVGDGSYGMRAVGYNYAETNNAGQINTGDDSYGMHTFAVNAASINTGNVVAGNDSVGINTMGAGAFVRNSGDVTVGAGSTGLYLLSAQATGVVINEGAVSAGEGGVAIEGQGYQGTNIYSNGLVRGSIVTGEGDDVLYNGVRRDSSNNIVGAGRIELDNARIDMGAGANTFFNVFGDILFSGDSTIELGTDGVMQNYSSGGSYVTISSMDDNVGDTLTINGDVNFTAIQGNNGLFLVDMSSNKHDRIVINGDLTAVNEVSADGATQPSTLGVAVNVTDQSKGEQTLDILTVNGEQNVGSVSLAAVGGDFADTILEAEMQQDGNGNWVIAYTAGLSDLGAAASSVSHLAESFWNRSASAFFDSERAANMSESSRVEGLHAWSTVFHTDSDMESRGDVKGQDLAYTQLLSNHMAGATYNTKLGGTWLSISPMVGKGYADGNQLAQQSSAALDTETFALNGSLSMGDFYASAMYQQVDFDANVRAYDSAAMTSGQAKGYSLEGGWTYLMESGIAMTSFAQWSDVKSEIDGFTSSDNNFDYAYNLGSTSTTRLGLSMRKSFKLADGFAVPYATFSVADSNNHSAHDLHSNGVVFNSDVSGSGFNLDFGVDGKYKLWTIKSGLGVHSGETDKNGLSGHFTISRSL